MGVENESSLLFAAIPKDVKLALRRRRGIFFCPSGIVQGCTAQCSETN